MGRTRRFRRLPPVCAAIAAVAALRGRLRFDRRLIGREIANDDGHHFRIFRHLLREELASATTAVFVVRFRFARFSQPVNRALSLIPIPLIVGFPDFREKLWMVDDETGDWQGVYEWASAEAAELYRRSFVLGLMNRRADPASRTESLFPGARLSDYLEERMV